jgi:hypothetical protein
MILLDYTVIASTCPDTVRVKILLISAIKVKYVMKYERSRCDQARLYQQEYFDLKNLAKILLQNPKFILSAFT